MVSTVKSKLINILFIFIDIFIVKALFIRISDAIDVALVQTMKSLVMLFQRHIKVLFVFDHSLHDCRCICCCLLFQIGVGFDYFTDRQTYYRHGPTNSFADELRSILVVSVYFQSCKA